MEQLTLDDYIDMNRDPLLKKVARYIVTTGSVNIGAVQSRFRLGFKRADSILHQLAEEGIIPYDYLATNHKEPLMTEEELLAWMRQE